MFHVTLSPSEGVGGNDAAVVFLTTLKGQHPGTKLETQVYRKPTNTGLLLHFHSHTDKRGGKQLYDLSHKIGPTLAASFVSKKLGQDLKPKEIKLSIVNQQCDSVICAIQIMLGTQPDTFINALLSTKGWQSVDIS